MKAMYIQPQVESTQVELAAIILAGSNDQGNVDMSGGGGGSIDPD